MTTSYTIKTVADRSGFTPATLRFYEDIGLLPAVARTDAGYRLYGDDAVARLAFIARAKQLGCTLDEIAGLVTAWDGGECGPLQDGLRTLVAAKIAGAQDRITELLTLTAELQAAASALERHRPDGPCDAACGCVAGTEAGETESQPVALGRRPANSSDAPPIACTLTPEAMPGRLDDWRQVLAHTVGRTAIDGGVRVTFATTDVAADLARLATAEHDCCRFFAFTITADERGLGLEVRAPDDARPLVDAVFGVPA